MADRDFFKINISSNTDSSSPATGTRQARIDLLLPSNLITPGRIPRAVKMQVSKCRLSLNSAPDLTVPVDLEASVNQPNRVSLFSKGFVTVWPYYLSGAVRNPSSTLPYTPALPRSRPAAFRAYPEDYSHIQRMTISKANLGSNDAEIRAAANNILAAGEYQYQSIQQYLDEFARCIDDALLVTRTMPYCAGLTHFKLGNDTISLVIEGIAQLANTTCPFWTCPFPPPGYAITPKYAAYPPDSADPDYEMTVQLMFAENQDINLEYKATGYSIVVSEEIKQNLPSLPWIKVSNSDLLPSQQITGWYELTHSNDFYVLDTRRTSIQVDRTLMPYNVWSHDSLYDNKYGATISYTFDSLPPILLNQLQSIAIIVQGINNVPQVHPINIRQRQGSSITTTVPIAELYYPMAQTLTEIHDDLVVTNPEFDTYPLISITPEDLKQRVITFYAGYIDKNGTLRYINLAQGGVFCMQITFGLYY